VRENSISKLSPAGTSELSPCMTLVLGRIRKDNPVPQGRLKTGRDATLGNLQPSLRDSIMLHVYPGLASWAKFSRPCGTQFVNLGSHRRSKVQSFQSSRARLKSCLDTNQNSDSALKHPLDADFHLGFVDYLPPICLFNPFANASAEAIILIDEPQSGIYHELVRVFVQMRRDLR
jgi:hypothetical protein